MTNEEFSIATLKSLWKDGDPGFLVTSPTTFPTHAEAKTLLDKYPHKHHMIIVRRTPGTDWRKHDQEARIRSRYEERDLHVRA